MEPTKPAALFDYKNVPWKVWQAFAVFALIWIVLPLVVVLLLGLLGGVLPVAGTLLEGALRGDIQASFVVSLLGDFAGIGVLVWMLRRNHVGLSTLGLRRFSLPQTIIFFVLMIVVFLLLVSMAYALVTLLYPGFDAAQSQTNEFTGANSPASKRISFIALVLIPPIIEETVFRGFIFPALAKRLGGIWGAIVTSILFGIAHWQLNVSVYTLVLSLLLCFMYVRLRSIIPGIFFHMFNNYLAYTVLMK